MNKLFGLKRFINIFCVSIFLIIIIFIFLLYGPFDGFRDFLITSAMSTKNHQYLATFFYSDSDISKSLNKNDIVESSVSSDPSLIDFKKSYSINKYEREILNRKSNDLYKVINISYKTFNGYMVAIYDPSKISVSVSNELGKSGEYITSVAKRQGVIVAMNASGFYDPNWKSNGALAHGIVISNGQIVSDYDYALDTGGLIGFTNENKLLLNKNISADEALKLGYRDAVEFGPFLIVNGKNSIVNGNGGLGIAPRSAIGQRRDGIVLLLVINGRLPSSIGADMNDLVDIFKRYKAINAANLDGGSSVELLINDKIVNKPVGGGKKGLRKMPTYFIVEK